MTVSASEIDEFWKSIADKLTPDEFKAFIVYTQEVEHENLVLKSEKEADEKEKAALREVLEETRDRVRTLELQLGKREEEIRLVMDESLLWEQQAKEYKFLYEHNRPSAFDKVSTKVGVGAAIASFVYFIVKTIN